MRLGHLILALAVAAASPLAAQDAPPRLVTVVGAAEAEAVPDIASITLGVETRAETASAALAANSEAMTAVFDTLGTSGIERRDIQTSQLNITPVYEPFREGAEAPQRVVAYDAANMVTIRVRAIDKLGSVIDAVTKAGSNRIYGIAFDLTDPKATLDTAREKAVEDARARAELYARAAGVTLGPVVSISETVQTPGPIMMRAAAEAAAPPVSEGTMTLSAQVEIVYAIE